MNRRKRRTFTPEQRTDAVRLVSETGGISKVAKDMDPTESALRNRVAQAQVDESQVRDGSLTTDEREGCDVYSARRKSLSRSEASRQNQRPSPPRIWTSVCAE